MAKRCLYISFFRVFFDVENGGEFVLQGLESITSDRSLIRLELSNLR